MFAAAKHDRGRKRVGLPLDALADARAHHRVLMIGSPVDRHIEFAKKAGLDVTWAGFHDKKGMRELLNQAHVGVCCSSRADSCPQTFVEYLATGLPAVVTNDAHLWFDKYVTPATGIAVEPEPRSVLAGIQYVLNNLASFSVHEYYERNLSMRHAIEHLEECLGEIL